MIIIWRYLLSEYLKVLLLCTVAFIAILLTTRLEDIAHFASLGAQGHVVLKFTMHQIPYILPIALPISCLISAIILVQKLSSTHELTALRAAGMPIRLILAPILISAALISLGNFYIVSEIATSSHHITNTLKSEMKAVNPLLLLHNKHMMRLQGIYFDTLGASRMGESASDVIIAMPNKKNNRINLVFAENLHAGSKNFTASGMTLVTSLKSVDGKQFDNLIIENIEKSVTSIQDFAQILQKKIGSLNNDHLKLNLLLIRIQEEKQVLSKAKENEASADTIKLISRNISKSYTEIVRRLSISLAAFTFTLMGLAFGITISRNASSRGLIYVIGLAAFFLIAFFSAKGIDYQFVSASILYLVPHAVIIAFSLLTLWRTSKGIE